MVVNICVIVAIIDFNIIIDSVSIIVIIFCIVDTIIVMVQWI